VFLAGTRSSSVIPESWRKKGGEEARLYLSQLRFGRFVEFSPVVSSFRSLAALVFACTHTLSGDGLVRIQAMLSELREVAWLAGIVSILSILGIGVAIGVALIAFT
jgi:hypothetical protein